MHRFVYHNTNEHAEVSLGKIIPQQHGFTYFTFASSVLPRVLYNDPSLMYTLNGGAVVVLISPLAVFQFSSILSRTAAHASAASDALIAPERVTRAGIRYITQEIWASSDTGDEHLRKRDD